MNRDEVAHLELCKRFAGGAFFFGTNSGNHPIGTGFFKNFAVIGEVDYVVGQPVQQPGYVGSVERIVIVKE